MRRATTRSCCSPAIGRARGAPDRCLARRGDWARVEAAHPIHHGPRRGGALVRARRPARCGGAGARSSAAVREAALTPETAALVGDPIRSSFALRPAAGRRLREPQTSYRSCRRCCIGAPPADPRARLRAGCRSMWRRSSASSSNDSAIATGWRCTALVRGSDIDARPPHCSPPGSAARAHARPWLAGARARRRCDRARSALEPGERSARAVCPVRDRRRAVTAHVH